MGKNRPRASVLVINKDKLALIFRHKKNKDYYSVPGGGIESGESPRLAAIREIKEELGFSLTKLTLISKEKTELFLNYNFLAYTSDTEFNITGPEKKNIDNSNNLFKPVWIDKQSFNYQIPLYPESYRDIVINLLKPSTL